MWNCTSLSTLHASGPCLSFINQKSSITVLACKCEKADQYITWGDYRPSFFGKLCGQLPLFISKFKLCDVGSSSNLIASLSLIMDNVHLVPSGRRRIICGVKNSGRCKHPYCGSDRAGNFAKAFLNCCVVTEFLSCMLRDGPLEKCWGWGAKH